MLFLMKDKEYNGIVARLGSNRLRHACAVEALAFTPTGSTIVSAGQDGSLRSWGEIEKKFPNTKGTPSALAVSFDLTLVAVGDSSGYVELFDLSTGLSVGRFRTLQQTITALVFSPDGQLLFVAGRGGQVISAWQLSSKTKLLEFAGHGEIEVDAGTLFDETEMVPLEVLALQIVPTEEDYQLLSGAEDGSVVFWNPTSGAEIKRHQLPTPAQKMVINSKGRVLLANKGEVQSLSFQGEEKCIHCEITNPLCLAMDNNEAIGWGTGNGKIEFISDSPTYSSTTLTHSSIVSELRFDDDNIHLLVKCKDETSWRWDIKSETVTKRDTDTSTLPVSYSVRGEVKIDNKTYPAAKASSCIVLSSDGQLAAFPSDRQFIGFLDLKKGSLKRLPGHSSEVLSVAFSQSAELAVSGDRSGAIYVWDVQRGAKKASYIGSGVSVVAIAISDSGVVAAGHLDGSVILWDSRIEVGISRAEVYGKISAVAISPDEVHVAIAAMDTVITIFDKTKLSTEIVQPDEPTTQIESPAAAIAHFPFAVRTDVGSNGTVYIASSLCAVLPYLPDSWLPTAHFEGHCGTVVAVALSPNESTLASLSEDSTLRLWNCHTRKELWSVPWSVGLDGSITFIDDNKLLVGTGRKVGVVSSIDGTTVSICPSSLYLDLASPIIGALGTTKAALLSSSPTKREVQFSLLDTSHWTRVLTINGNLEMKGMSLRSIAPNAAVVCAEKATLFLGHTDGTLELRRLENGALESTIVVPGHIEKLALSPEGTLLAVGLFDGSVILYQRESMGELRRFSPPSSTRVTGLSFFPDGTKLLASYANRHALLWEFAESPLM